MLGYGHLIGQTDPHYRIIEQIGAGGMGVVYKAVDVNLERTVALKFLPTDVALNPRDKETILREARAASALDHPNIGVIYGVEESDEHQLFIAMGYYEGETLAQKLARGPIHIRGALELAVQIARGLSAAHTRHIVHRDIKPSNVIITREGVAKIVDFGLARVVASLSSTQSESISGTLPYMAPEQILSEPVDQRTDLWALGVILVQMITGKHPFLRANAAATTYAIVHQPPDSLDAVPRAIRPIAYRALAKKPESRYATADEMLRDLEAAQAECATMPASGDEPTVTTTAVSSRQLKKYIQNATTANPRWSLRRLVLPTVGLVIAAIVALLIPPVRESLVGIAYAGSEKHIAVLPFASPGNDPDFGPVAEGLMDSLTNRLSNLDSERQSLWVVPAGVVRNRKVSDPTAAFRELGATMVVQGTVRRTGKTVYLSLVLVDAKHLRQIGSVDLQDRSGDLAALQNEALSHLARMMKVSVPDTSLATFEAVTPSAYELYLKALAYLQRYDKPGNPDLAITALNSAITKDPRFAMGYATLGEAYRLKFMMDHDPQWIDGAFANCEKALKIDGRMSAVHVTLGQLRSTLGNKDSALQEFQKALEITPRDAGALMGLANVYEQMGRIQDAETTYQRAIALRPDYWAGYSELANFYSRQKRVQDSLAQYRRVVELTPDNPVGFSDLGVEYMELNDSAGYAAAEAAFRQSISLVPNYQAYANLGWLYLQQKRYLESVAASRKALDLNDKDWRVWSNLQLAYTWLKDEDKVRETRAKTLALVEEYASVNTHEAPVQSMLSILYAEDKLRDKALTHARAALALAPKDPWILADIAETYDQLGDRKTAIHYAQDSLKNGFTLTDLHQRPALVALLADPSFTSPGKKQS